MSAGRWVGRRCAAAVSVGVLAAITWITVPDASAQVTSRAFVSSPANDRVYPIDTRTSTRLPFIAISCGPQTVAMSPDGRRAYVCAEPFSNTAGTGRRMSRRRPRAGSSRKVPAGQRVTVNIAGEDPALATAAVATRVESDRPIIVERAQYWPNPAWHEAHNSFGVTETATRWGLAEGRVGGDTADQTYILLAHPGSPPASVTLTFLRTDGTTIVKPFTVTATSRFNVAVSGAGSDVPELANEAFGTLIESTQPIVVERSVYSNVGGIIWAAGSNATATRLP